MMSALARLLHKRDSSSYCESSVVMGGIARVMWKRSCLVIRLMLPDFCNFSCGCHTSEIVCRLREVVLTFGKHANFRVSCREEGATHSRRAQAERSHFARLSFNLSYAFGAVVALQRLFINAL